MAAVLELLLLKQVSPEDIVAWLIRKTDKDLPLLRSLDKCRSEFIPFFLNFLRDQSLRTIQNKPLGSLTPSKNPTPIKKPSAIVSTHQKRTNSTFKPVELFPKQKVTESESVSPIINNVGDSLPIGASRNGKRYLQNSNSERHSKTSVDYRSQQKFSLGEFILSPDNNNLRKKNILNNHQKQDFNHITPGRNKKNNENLKNNLSFKKNVTLTENTHDLSFNLNDLEAFPPVGSHSLTKAEQQKRRITPTPASCKTRFPQVNAFSLGRLGNSNIHSIANEISSYEVNSAFATPPQESIKSFEEERELLRKEKAKQQNGTHKQTSNSVVKPATDAGGLIVKRTNTCEIIAAKLNMVSHLEELKLLARLYSSCLIANLAPNISVEFYFLMHLLTVRDCSSICDGESPDEPCYFDSVHNCVYFSIQVLEAQKIFLKLLDKATLKLLADNPRIQNFSPSFHLCLSEICGGGSSLVKSVSYIGSPVTGVSFQSDVDNRNNFPTSQSFHIFRKQRDLFYELLREWEANHMLPGWSMSTQLGDRIRSLLYSAPDPTVYMHFSRLFMSQLISMCKGESLQTGESEKLEDSDLLSDLKRSNPEKFKRLQDRFVTPHRLGGPSPPPSFPGPQEFFRDFIYIAACPSFNQHLTDSLIYKINKLNDVQFTLPESESSESQVDDCLRQQFASCLLTLKLLAKFLGLVVFLPYRTSVKVSEDLQANHIMLRNQHQPPINTTLFLKQAIHNYRTILTFPWIIEYLSMMDSIASHLDYIQESLILLIRFYRSSHLQLGRSGFNLNNLFLVMVIGWLFETPNFPVSLFFIENFELLDIYDTANLSNSQDIDFSVDSYELIDHQLLFTCCPYLGELKALLGDFAAGINSSSSTVKKITPISADDHQTVSLSARQLELQLEENFFHNHPTSLRKTVEFVTERMASNVIKHIRKHTVPNAREDGLRKLYKLLQEKLKEDNKPPAKLKSSFVKRIHDISQEICTETRKSAEEFTISYCNSRVTTSLHLLLSDDTILSVQDSCAKITSRKTHDKVTQWVSTHVTTNLFVEDLQSEMDKLFKLNNVEEVKVKILERFSKCCTNKKKNMLHSKETPSTTDTVILLKDTVRDLYSSGNTITSYQLDDLLKLIQKVLEFSQDVTVTISKCLSQLSLELLLGLVIVHPDIITESRIEQCLKIWIKGIGSSTPLIICPRNIMLLNSSRNYKISWNKFEIVLKIALKQNLLSVKNLEDQCIGLWNQEWSEETLHHFAECLQGIILFCQSYFSEDGNDFTQFLEWLKFFEGANRENVSPR